MAFLRSLFAGVSGLRNHQLMMDVIGNNISNINTVGYKGSRTTFGEAFAQTLRNATQPLSTNGGSNPIQVGLGMTVNTVDVLFSQGNIETTGQATDLAIQGSGFFAVNKDGKTYYTRVGTFSFDSAGNLGQPGTGAVLQGKLADVNGKIPAGTKLESLKISRDQKVPAQATTSVKISGNMNSASKTAETALSGNLNSAAAVGATETSSFKVTDDFGVEHTVTATLTKSATANQWDVSLARGGSSFGTGTLTFDATTGKSSLDMTATMPSTGGAPPLAIKVSGTGLTQKASASSLTSTFEAAESTSVSATVYDSLGNKKTITLNLTKSATENEWTWSADVDSPSTITAGRTGKISFAAGGALKSFTYDDGSLGLTLDPKGGADVMTLDIQPGTYGTIDGLGQNADVSKVTAIADGYGAGSLDGISIDNAGNINGSFSNGIKQLLGQVAMLEFNNPSGLLRVGDNMYDISGNSGAPNMVTGGTSTIVSGALEQSNVDLADEFTKMITAQRGFQANARIITTSDEFLQEVVNLKR